MGDGEPDIRKDHGGVLAMADALCEQRADVQALAATIRSLAGITGNPVLFELPTTDIVMDTPADPMHMAMNFGEKSPPCAIRLRFCY